jgi:hypothetical protein
MLHSADGVSRTCVPQRRTSRSVNQIMRTMTAKALVAVFTLICASVATADTAPPAASEQHLLYVAVPGIRNELKWGGAGILVFDIDNGHKFVRRIPTDLLDSAGKPEALRGICATAVTKRLYVSTTKSMACLDLLGDKILWNKVYDHGCDRMSIAPDGKTIFVPSMESDIWNVVEAGSGDVLSVITTNSGAHNTVFAIDGGQVYLAGLKSSVLTIADAHTREAVGTVGPFGGFIRPFTVNGKGTVCFCCVNGLLGFEIGDLKSGKLLYRIEVPGFKVGPTARHGCPSHGIGMTPDESEIWVADAYNRSMHVFDATVMPPKLINSISLREEPGWITFSIDGRYAYPSTGDVIDVKSKKIVTTLEDETGRDVESEKLVEIDFSNGVPVRAGDQFGRGEQQ